MPVPMPYQAPFLGSMSSGLGSKNTASRWPLAAASKKGCCNASGSWQAPLQTGSQIDGSLSGKEVRDMLKEPSSMF